MKRVYHEERVFPLASGTSSSSDQVSWFPVRTKDNDTSGCRNSLESALYNYGADVVSAIRISAGGDLISSDETQDEPSVCDVATYILQRLGSMSTWKLQKLVYYCQAWSLVWDGEPLYPEVIKAWKNGPVVPALYAKHKGMFKISIGDIPGDPSHLRPDQLATIDSVLNYYGQKSPQWLSDLTHMEDPWRDARRHRGSEESPIIPLDSIAAYYESLEDEENS